MIWGILITIALFVMGFIGGFWICDNYFSNAPIIINFPDDMDKEEIKKLIEEAVKGTELINSED